MGALDQNLKIGILLVSLNLVLSFLHFILEKIKDKTDSKIDNGLYDLISNLQNVVNWIMGNRKN